MDKFNVMLIALILSVLIFDVRGANETGVGVLIRPTKIWRILDADEKPVVRPVQEDYHEFSVGDIRCLRYCVEGKVPRKEESDVVQVTWKLGTGSGLIFEKDFMPEILRKESIKSEDSEDIKNKCMFSVTIGCTILNGNKSNLGTKEKMFIKSLQPNDDITKELDDKEPPALNFLRERLVDEVSLINETEVNFNVQPNRAEMNVIVFGNLSDVDIKMPIGAKSSATVSPRLTLATTRMPSGASGVRLNIAKPPPGGWSLRLQGQGSQKYRLVVMVNGELLDLKAPAGIDTLGEESSLLDNANEQNEYQNLNIASRQVKSLDFNVDRIDEAVIPDNFKNKGVSLGVISGTESSDDQKESKSFKFPSAENDIVNLDLNGNITTRMDTNDDDIETRVIDREFIELSDLNNPLTDELPIRKYLTVELNPRTELFAHPGTYHRLTFDITNNHVLRIKHYLFPASSPFPVFGIPSRFVILEPGQTVSVPVDIVVPPQVGDSVNKVTLRVEGIEVIEKSANFYVRTSSSRVYDDKRPDIYYYFNNNCHGRYSGENCLKSYWSVDVVVQDYDSGIKSVVSVPKGIYPRTPYVSGTSTPTNFYYSNNCCNRVVEVTATDASGNVYSRRIDVDEWTNLTTGEVLAIIFIILFIILLIVLIVLSVVYCYKRKKSLDLPYSQRYGSRASPQ